MSSIRAIRQRVRSIKNIAKITKAMQMVASSKMRKSQERVQRSRPYVERLRMLVSHHFNALGEDSETRLALLRSRPVRNIGVILMTPDRNLCGALPSNINRQAMMMALDAQKRLARQGFSPAISFIAVGRRGRDFLVRTQHPLLAEFTNYGDTPSLADAAAIAQVAVDAFLHGDVDLIFLAYAQFISIMSQQPAVVQLLPIRPSTAEQQAQQKTEYIYEPDPEKILEALLSRSIDVQIYQALLETVASEQAAQMVAMKSATDNAHELIQDLTLVMNKARQASITTEILEVASGAESVAQK